jgi:hypothetical protein
VVANTAAQSAGSATSAVSGFNLGSLFGGGGDGLGNLFGGATSGIDWGQTPSIVGTPFASGGFVTGPTQAVIGEGGTSEYVIPANKMPSAMARWNAGARGEAVVNGADPTGGSEGGGALGGAPTQISISGGILQFNDSNYIRQDQVPAIVNQASQAGEQRALRKLQMSPATRRRVGV